MLENSIALVVGCMPAFAAFIRIHNPSSTFFKSLRSKVFRDRNNGKNGTPKATTIAAQLSPAQGFKSDDQVIRPVHMYHYELNDNAPITHVDIAASEPRSNSYLADNQQAIFKMISLSQASHARSPV